MAPDFILLMLFNLVFPSRIFLSDSKEGAVNGKYKKSNIEPR
jgi:hypothetical protein